MRSRSRCFIPVALFALSVGPLSGCTNQIKDALSGCDELNQGSDAVAQLNIDAKAKAFVQATADLKTMTETITGDVKTACASICTDLGEADTWSSREGDDAISNGDKTGACDVAAARIDAIMTAAVQGGVNFSLEISGGECTVDTDVQTSCEASCQTDVTCTEPQIETRCDPAELSVDCQGACKASAVCEGSVAVAASCQGSCAAECTGTCSGECRGKVTGGCDGMCEGTCDGVATPAGGMAACAGVCEGHCSALHAMATCTGKCSATCTGKCSGECKLDATANVACGANVRCRGGCMTSYTAPKCETELKPPVCQGDTNCQTSCSSQASARAACTPPHVALVVTGSASDDVTKLKATIEANFPKIVTAAQTEGPLVVHAAEKVVSTGTAVATSSATLGGKELACSTQAAGATVKASASLSVSVNASANVTSSCSNHSS